MTDALAGDCPGCQRTFERLDALLAASVNHEVEITGCDKRTATLHVLAAVQSWWFDRSLQQFPNRAAALRAMTLCIDKVCAEQGI